MNIYRRKDEITKKRCLFVSSYTADSARQFKEIPGCEKTKNGYKFPDSGDVLKMLSSISCNESRQRKIQEEQRIKADYQAILDSKAGAYAVVDDIYKRILNREPIEALPDSCDMLMNHQKGGSRIAEYFDKFAFFYDTGTGKTLMALEIIHQKEISDNAHFLVLCPKTIIHTAWLDDCERFYPKMKLLPLSVGTTIDQYRLLKWRWRENDKDFSYGSCFFLERKREREERVKSHMASIADHYIVNFELFNRDPEQFLYIDRDDMRIPIDGIIVDESSILKNGNSLTYANLRNLCAGNRIKYLYLFSGKPAPNKVSEYFPQIRLVAPYLKLPTFESIENQPGRYEKELLLTMQKASITVSKQDCFELPKTTELVRKVFFDNKLMQQYRSMAYQFYTEVQDIEKENPDNKRVVVNHVLASIMKLRQLTGGFIKSNNEFVQVHRLKLDELNAVIDELGGQQAIIWCQFQYEIQTIEKMLLSSGHSVVTAYGKTRDKEASIAAFKNGDAEFLIAHPRTLQYGVTLVNCCYAIYFSTSYSFEEHYQSHDRIYRKGQTLPCTYIYLQAENTIDEVMYSVIREKKDRTECTELFLKHMCDVGREIDNE